MDSNKKLLEMLSSEKASTRYDACEWLRVSQESSPEIIHALEKASRDPNKDVSERANIALKSDVHHQMAIQIGMIKPVHTYTEGELSTILEKGAKLILDCVQGGISIETFLFEYDSFYMYHALDGHESDIAELELLQKYEAKIAIHKKIWDEVITKITDNKFFDQNAINKGFIVESEGFGRLKEIAEKYSYVLLDSSLDEKEIAGIWYTAIKKFDPTIGQEWIKYQGWAKIPHLRELISLDSFLKPDELWKLIDSDWNYNIQVSYFITFFWDLDYILKRFENIRDKVNVLAVCLEPSSEVRESFKDSRFEFQGYDLLDIDHESVIIQDPSYYEKAFKINDISEVGLFTTYDFARSVQKLIHQHFDTDSNLWAIWKMVAE
jgi:hypothetical protein